MGEGVTRTSCQLLTVPPPVQVVYSMYRPTLKKLLLLTRPLPEDGELEEGEEAPGGWAGGGEGGAWRKAGRGKAGCMSRGRGGDLTAPCHRYSQLPRSQPSRSPGLYLGSPPPPHPSRPGGAKLAVPAPPTPPSLLIVPSPPPLPRCQARGPHRAGGGGHDLGRHSDCDAREPA